MWYPTREGEAMNPRFDLPPEVMLGERVVKPVPAPVKPEDRWLPLAENKDVQVNGSGQMRTNVPLPAVSFADLAMLAADRGPENEEDDPVDETDVKQAQHYLAAGAQERLAAQQILQRHHDAHREAERRAMPGPRFRVMRNGISTTLTAPELTEQELSATRGQEVDSDAHFEALWVEHERAGTFIDVPHPGLLKWRTSLRQATDEDLRAYGKMRTTNVENIAPWTAECKRRGITF
jgi:hypothetical protein